MRYMAALASGKIKKDGLTPDKAKDYLDWQDYGSLPESAPKKPKPGKL